MKAPTDGPGSIIEDCHIRADGVCVMHIMSGAMIDTTAAVTMVRERNRVMAGRRLPFILFLPVRFDYQPTMLTTDVTIEMHDVVTRAAIVCPDPHLRDVAVVYYASIPRPFPTKVVADEEEAMRWLHGD